MLDQCAAIVIAPNAEGEVYLQELAAVAGFREVAVYGTDQPQSRLAFFLLHFRVGEDKKRAVLADIRADRRIRFSPVVIVTGEYSNEDMGRYVRWGFDDILDSADDAAVLKQRLESKLTGEQILLRDADLFRAGSTPGASEPPCGRSQVVEPPPL